MKKDRAMKNAVGILVLGMHRSGTSALTRMLNILGCALPDNLLGSNQSNPEGHWESLRAIEINDALLAALGRKSCHRCVPRPSPMANADRAAG